MGRDAYDIPRLVDETRQGLHISVRNPLHVQMPDEPRLPGSGAGLLGLKERVTLAGGVLSHGPTSGRCWRTADQGVVVDEQHSLVQDGRG